MKIAHVCLEAPYLDGYTYQENLLPEYHARAGHETTVIASRNLFPSYVRDIAHYAARVEPYAVGGVTVRRLEGRSTWFGKVNRYPEFARVLREIEPDLAFFHGGQSISLLDAKRYRRSRPGTRLFVDFHAEAYNSGRGVLSRFLLHRGLWRFVIRRWPGSIDRVYCITPAVADFTSKCYGIDPAEISYLYLGCEPADAAIDLGESRRKARSDLDLHDDSFVVAFGGKIDAAKRFDLFARAIALAGPRCYGLVFGAPVAGYEDEYRRLSASCDRIKTLGWVEGKDIARILAAADIACFPGSQSVIWQQAIGAGLPCVFRKWPGTEYLNEGNAVFLEGDEVGELAELLRSLSDPSASGRLAEMATAARKLAREKLSYERQAAIVVEDYLRSTGRQGAETA